jgi:hypothetical protein
MAAATAKKTKKIQHLTEDDEQATGLWIEPSLLPTRLAQRGLRGQSVQAIFESQLKFPGQAGKSREQYSPQEDRRFGSGRRQRPE